MNEQERLEEFRRQRDVLRYGRTDLPEIDIPGACDEGMVAARWLMVTGATLLVAPPLVFIPAIGVVKHLYKAGKKLGC